MKALGRGSIASLVETGLQVFGVILWIALIGVGVGAVSYGVIVALVAADVLPVAILEGGDGAIQSGGETVNVSVDGGLAWQRVVPALLAAAVAIIGGIVIVRRLRRLFESFRSAEPFRKENATHLRVIWITMMVIELSRYAILALTGVLFAAFGAPDGTDAKLNLNINLTAWAGILILIVLAEVFREGTRLREEQDLTI